MNSILVLSIAFASYVCDAATYNCVLEKREGKPAKLTRIWAGTLSVDEKKVADTDSVAIKPNGEAVSLTKLITGIPESSGENWKSIVETRLKPYEGFPVVTLWKDYNRIKLVNGHSAIKPADQSSEAFAWASMGTTELGLINYKSDLQVSCTRK